MSDSTPPDNTPPPADTASATAPGADRPWWRSRDWWRRRRWWAAGGAAAVLSIAFGTAVFLTRDGEAAPEDVVADYLAAVQSGDAAAALEYVGEVDVHEADDSLLVDEAMTSDWEVTRLVSRWQGEDVSTRAVDVTITAADGTSREGRFALEQTDDGWQIRNPLVALELPLPPVEFAEFTSVATDADTVWLFPGAYEPYPSISELLVLDHPVYVAVPEDGSVRFRPRVEFTETVEQRFHEHLAAWLDDCADTTDPYPEGCPFSAREELLPGEVRIGEFYYETEELRWEIVEYPTAQVEPGWSGLGVNLIEPGEVRFRGEGTPLAPRDSGSEESFSGRCEFRLGDGQAEMTGPDDFSFDVESPRIRCR